MTTGKLVGSLARRQRLPNSFAWGPTGWNAALSHASSTYRSSQGILRSIGILHAPQDASLSTGMA